MRSTSILSCIMIMMSNLCLTIFFIFQIFIFKFSFAFSYDSCCSFVNSLIFLFVKLIIFIACSLKNSRNFFMQSLPVHASCLFPMLLNEDIVDIEKPDGICSLTFVVDGFSGLFLHLSIFSIIHSRSAQLMNGALSDFWY